MAGRVELINKFHVEVVRLVRWEEGVVEEDGEGGDNWSRGQA